MPMNPADPAPSPDSIRQELARLLASPAFAGALAHQRLLRHLVEQTLAGNSGELKETVLGIEVFQRPAHSFDPRRDSIVRVEARRLRERLRQHYADTPGATLSVQLRSGSYVPLFVHRSVDTVRAGAAELVERGHFLLREGQAGGYRKALERFEAAAQAAPDYAPAHAGVARAWVQLVANTLEPALTGLGPARAAVDRALALQPAHAESLVLAAQIAHRFEFNWPAARALFERAARAAPDSAFVRHSLAFSLMARGQLDSAAQALAEARSLDPMNLGLRASQGLLHLYAREWEAAEDALQALLDLSPEHVLGASLLAYVNLCRGDAEAALAMYTTLSQRHPAWSIGAAGEVWSLAAMGRTEAARSALASLEQQWSDGRYLSPYQLAMAACWLGDDDETLTLLEQAVQSRDANAMTLPVDPAFDRLAGLPRFKALRAQVLGTKR